MFRALFRNTGRYVQPGLRHFSMSKTTKMASVIRKGEAALAGTFLMGMLTWLVQEAFRQTGLGAKNISGLPTPPALKDPNNPDRYVFQHSELTYDGQGNGHEGRSCPLKYTIKLADGQIKHGYEKISNDGRDGMLNEMVFHLLAYQLLPESQPMSKLIEHPKDNDTSEYSLWIESIGDNCSLLQLSIELNASPKRLDDVSIAHLGTACAFARLVNSIDNFLKNYVVVLHDDEVYVVYAIDFEKCLSEPLDLAFKFICFDLPARKAATKFLDQGAILEYKRIESFNEKMAAASESAKQDGVGESSRVVGWNHNEVRKIFIDGITQDIEDGSILKLYRKAAALTVADIEALIKPLEHVLVAAEKIRYIEILKQIANESRTIVEEFDSKKTPDDEGIQNTVSMFKK